MRHFLYGAVFGYLFHLLLASTVARAEEKPLLFIDAPISGESVRPIRDALQARILSPDTDDIDLMIDSPGGEVIAGQEIVNLIGIARDKGHNVNCYVLNVAASMAFQILTACSDRYTLPGSFLLWHGVRVQVRQPLTAELAQSVAEDLARMNELTMSQLKATIDMSPEDLKKHFVAETLWSGYTLHVADPKFIGIKTGYYDLAKRIPTAVRTAQVGLFGLLGNITYIYRWDGRKVGN